MIDGHPVVTKVTVSNVVDSVSYPSENWIKDHVRTSQYLLQIRKCGNRVFCLPYRSNIGYILPPPGSVPGPVTIMRGEGGMSMGDPLTSCRQSEWLQIPWRLALDNLIETEVKLNPVPFDYFCVSTRSTLAQRYCKFCSITS